MLEPKRMWYSRDSAAAPAGMLPGGPQRSARYPAQTHVVDSTFASRQTTLFFLLQLFDREQIWWVDAASTGRLQGASQWSMVSCLHTFTFSCVDMYRRIGCIVAQTRMA